MLPSYSSGKKRGENNSTYARIKKHAHIHTIREAAQKSFSNKWDSEVRNSRLFSCLNPFPSSKHRRLRTRLAAFSGQCRPYYSTGTQRNKISEKGKERKKKTSSNNLMSFVYWGSARVQQRKIRFG